MSGYGNMIGKMKVWSKRTPEGGGSTRWPTLWTKLNVINAIKKPPSGATGNYDENIETVGDMWLLRMVQNVHEHMRTC